MHREITSFIMYVPTRTKMEAQQNTKCCSNSYMPGTLKSWTLYTTSSFSSVRQKGFMLCGFVASPPRDLLLQPTPNPRHNPNPSSTKPDLNPNLDHDLHTRTQVAETIAGRYDAVLGCT